jgi:hypothetical protein
MKTAIISVSLVSLFAFTGCAGLNDGYKTYSDSYSSHMEYESERIARQSEEIRESASLVRTTTALEGALVGVIAMMSISRLEPVPFTLTAPTTAYDMGMEFINQIPFMAFGLTSYGIAKQAIQNAGNINMAADQLTVSDSFNRTSSNVIGDSNGVTIPFKQVTTSTSTK